MPVSRSWINLRKFWNSSEFHSESCPKILSWPILIMRVMKSTSVTMRIWRLSTRQNLSRNPKFRLRIWVVRFLSRMTCRDLRWWVTESRSPSIRITVILMNIFSRIPEFSRRMRKMSWRIWMRKPNLTSRNTLTRRSRDNSRREKRQERLWEKVISPINSTISSARNQRNPSRWRRRNPSQLHSTIISLVMVVRCRESEETDISVQSVRTSITANPVRLNSNTITPSSRLRIHPNPLSLSSLLWRTNKIEINTEEDTDPATEETCTEDSRISSEISPRMLPKILTSSWTVGEISSTCSLELRINHNNNNHNNNHNNPHNVHSSNLNNKNHSGRTNNPNKTNGKASLPSRNPKTPRRKKSSRRPRCMRRDTVIRLSLRKKSSRKIPKSKKRSTPYMSSRRPKLSEISCVRITTTSLNSLRKTPKNQSNNSSRIYWLRTEELWKKKKHNFSSHDSK